MRVYTINWLWKQPEELYDKSWDQIAGLGQDGYDTLNDMILEILRKLQVMSKRHDN